MDTIWISQVLIGIIMAVMGIYLFKKYPFILSTKVMVQVALLMVIAVLLGSWFKLELPIFGPSTFEIKFDTLPILFIGILFGPVWGFVSGFMVDMIQLVLAPTPFPYLGFTFNLVLTGVVAGVIFHRPKPSNLNLYTRITQMLVLVMMLISIGLVAFVDQFRLSGQMVELKFWTKMMVSIALLVVGIVLIVIVERTKDNSFSSRYMRVVIMCEIIIQMLLTSLWLNILFKIPFWLLVVPRVIEGVFMILILHGIGLMLAKGVFNQQLIKNN